MLEMFTKKTQTSFFINSQISLSSSVDNFTALQRLRMKIPQEFTAVGAVERTIPEDLIRHPYFDSQSGFKGILLKFPQLVQNVDERIRILPPHLAPHALDEFTAESSPEPKLVAFVESRLKEAAASGRPQQGVAINSLYEALPIEERRRIKAHYRSFVRLLRLHGRWLEVSDDRTEVRPFDPSKRRDFDRPFKPSTNAAVLELYEAVLPDTWISLAEAKGLLEEGLRKFLPPTVDFFKGADKFFQIQGEDGDSSMIRRSLTTVALDMVEGFYSYIPRDGISVEELFNTVPPFYSRYLETFTPEHVFGKLFVDWFRFEGDIVTCTRSIEEVEAAIAAFHDGSSEGAEEGSEQRLAAPKYLSFQPSPTIPVEAAAAQAEEQFLHQASLSAENANSVLQAYMQKASDESNSTRTETENRAVAAVGEELFDPLMAVARSIAASTSSATTTGEVPTAAIPCFLCAMHFINSGVEAAQCAELRRFRRKELASHIADKHAHSPAEAQRAADAMHRNFLLVWECML